MNSSLSIAPDHMVLQWGSFLDFPIVIQKGKRLQRNDPDVCMVSDLCVLTPPCEGETCSCFAPSLVERRRNAMFLSCGPSAFIGTRVAGINMLTTKARSVKQIYVNI